MRTATPPLLLGLLLGGLPLALLFVSACGGSGGGSGEFCAAELPGVQVQVSGTYRYAQGLPGPYGLLGTIVFSQVGDTVTVESTTYDNANDRELTGSADLSGNRLDITLVPKDGSGGYSADVTFLFGDGGSTFCCSFSDTNADVGPMGSYRGVLQP
jgi:hypothetical protein